MLEIYHKEHERHRRTNKGFTVDIHGFIETWDDTMNIYINLSHNTNTKVIRFVISLLSDFKKYGLYFYTMHGEWSLQNTSWHVLAVYYFILGTKFSSTSYNLPLFVPHKY